jgi:hypothetical protein
MTSKQDKIINEKIFNQIRATSAFVGILKHHGKLSVPRDVFMSLITEKQEWPNDFIYKNGSSMLITYNEDDDSFSFELKYLMDGDMPDNAVGYQCTRNQTEVGFVDHDSPLYRS